MKIGRKQISQNSETYFIADIAANHDGSLKRAKKLITLCAKAGANAAKFQHFKAETIVSDKGFKQFGKKSHQSKWKKSVFQTYKDASIDPSWTKELCKYCKKNGIDFITTPYDINYVNDVNKYVCAYKIGSGDLTWHEIIKQISSKRKPVILATGASKLEEVKEAVKLILKKNKKLVLMQCNTNYTNSEDNFNYINLKVLDQYKELFGNKVILGLSDHTLGHSTVLGSVVMGAKVIEKHFTDNNNRSGPDHKFSMNFDTWKSMVEDTRRLEKALGDGKKKIEKNERQTSFLQRRGLYLNKVKTKNEKIQSKDLTALRPYQSNGYHPYEIKKLIGKKVKRKILEGECIKKNMIRR